MQIQAPEPPNSYDEICGLHEVGYSVLEISQIGGWSRTWIYRVHDKFGLIPNPKRGRARPLSPVTKQAILLRYRAGLTVPEIVSQTTATIHQVRYLIRINRSGANI